MLLGQDGQEHSAGSGRCLVDGENKSVAAQRLAKIELIARTDRYTVFKTDQDEAVIYEKGATGKAVLRGVQAHSFWEELMALKAISDCRRAITMNALCETYLIDPIAEMTLLERSLLALETL